MPRYFTVHCPVCGQTQKRPGIKQPIYCSRKCWEIGIRQEISKRLDVRRKISKAKKSNNWMKGRTGSKHHNWQGGKLWWRGKEWDVLKEEMRKRDCYHCQHCNMTDNECIDAFGGPLQVHHIIPYRLSHDNSPENLRTLCNRCHTTADHDFYWVL